MVDPVKKPEAKTAEPAPPPKQYVVMEEFVDSTGHRWLPRHVLTLPDDKETAELMSAGTIDEWVAPPELQGHPKSQPPGVAPKAPAREHKA